MPRSYMMSWEGSPNYRWSKMYRGLRYRITCDELRVPRTKEESYQAANEWWRNKLAELQVEKIDEDRFETLSQLDRKLTFALTHAPDLVAKLQRARTEASTATPTDIIMDDEKTVDANLEAARMFGISVPDDLDPELLQYFFGDKKLWAERFRTQRHVDKEKTLQANIDRFLSLERLHQKPATYKDLAKYLNRLKESPFWTAQSDVTKINEQTITDHYVWLSEQNYAPEGHNKRLQYFRRFVTNLWQDNIIEAIPRNLKKKSHRKKVVHKQVQRFSNVPNSPCKPS